MTIIIPTFAVLCFLALVFLARRLLARYGWLDSILWRAAYGRYLESPRWRALSRQVRGRDDWTCRECGEHQEIVWQRQGEYMHLSAKPIMQTHHLPGTYAPWWFYWLRLPERKRHLVTLCRECHARAGGWEE